jgi:addiction module HigA family antidote
MARALGATPARINKIARERRGITADTALRLSRFFNTSYQFWMNLHCAEDAAGRSIARIKPFAKSTDAARAT